MTRRTISVYDAPITLGDDATLEDHHIVVQTPSYGRVLFAGPVCGVYIAGNRVTVRNNYLEVI
jgi:hypothetical protein